MGNFIVTYKVYVEDVEDDEEAEMEADSILGFTGADHRVSKDSEEDED